MPLAPGCRGNYRDGPKVSTFHFPLDHPERLKKWLKSIPRKDLADIVSKNTVICHRHFAEYFIVKEVSVTNSQGQPIKIPRRQPKLTNLAYPTIFFNDDPPIASTTVASSPIASTPIASTTTVSTPTSAPRSQKKRKLIGLIPERLSNHDPLKSRETTPNKRMRAMQERHQNHLDNVVSDDRVRDFKFFKEKFTSYMRPMDKEAWIVKEKKDRIFFLSVNPDSPVPKLVSIIRIFSDMTVQVFTVFGKSHSLVEEPESTLKKFTSSGRLCSWDYFKSILTVYAHEQEEANEADPTQSYNDSLSDIEIFFKKLLHFEGIDSDKRKKIEFFKEQTHLLRQCVNRYSTELILTSFKLYITNKKTYNFLRSNVCTLPHPSALDKISAKFSMTAGVQQSTAHKEYLRLKASMLKDSEKDVCLLLDEIHISHQISYQAGRIEGTADNSLVEASTAQVSIIRIFFIDKLTFWLLL